MRKEAVSNDKPSRVKVGGFAKNSPSFSQVKSKKAKVRDIGSQTVGSSMSRTFAFYLFTFYLTTLVPHHFFNSAAVGIADFHEINTRRQVGKIQHFLMLSARQQLFSLPNNVPGEVAQ